MGNLHDENDKLLVFDRVDDTVLALADPVAVLSGELLTPLGAWIIGERLNPPDYPLATLLLGN